MLPEIGHSALLFAFLLALVACLVPFQPLLLKRKGSDANVEDDPGDHISSLVSDLVRAQFALVSRQN